MHWMFSYLRSFYQIDWIIDVIVLFFHQTAQFFLRTKPFRIRSRMYKKKLKKRENKQEKKKIST